MSRKAPNGTTEAAALEPPAPRLLFDLPPLVERIALPAPYAPHWVEVRLDLPDNALGEQALKIDILAKIVTAWSLQQPDGLPAPVGYAAMVALWDQATPLFLWLYEEWQARRWRPLVVPPTPLNSPSLPQRTA